VRIALDTNVLACAEGVNGASMRKVALELVESLPHEAVVLPVQTLGELFQVLVRKAGRSTAEARAAVLSWRETFSLIETSATAMLSALDLVVHHQLGLWDAVVLSAAAEADCALLLSEDLHNGFVWQGVTIVNPFVRPRHRLLATLLE
jgi:predicted nucleic acid-binding protein